MNSEEKNTGKKTESPSHVNEPETTYSKAEKKFVKRNQLDEEFFDYWIRLSEQQQISLLNQVKEMIDGENYVLSDEQMALVMAEREKYLRGEGKTYSWDEVKDMMRSKEKRR